jgi:hypothetical protein
MGVKSTSRWALELDNFEVQKSYTFIFYKGRDKEAIKVSLSPSSVIL